MSNILFYVFTCAYIHIYTYTHICLYVYVYISIYMDIYGYTYVYIHTHICIHVYVYTSLYMDVHIWRYMYIHMCIYVYIHICIHVYMYKYVHIYVWIYIYTYTHPPLLHPFIHWWILRLFPSLGVGFPGSPVVKNLPAVQETWRHRFDPWVRKIPWRRKWQPTAVIVHRKPHGQRCPTCSSPWGRKRVGHDWATK